ncbi:hypothetical protein G4B88_019494 [Cannabis sativa]|uniref:DUF4283 domain-containing protein n=1 Tax=Cannabis sativa TaxID=3483 RepID=A0A7J6HZ79_CANSA|nr:hypothetical protein G4B88_019494 [Cannabis sativa]
MKNISEEWSLGPYKRECMLVPRANSINLNVVEELITKTNSMKVVSMEESEEDGEEMEGREVEESSGECNQERKGDSDEEEEDENWVIDDNMVTSFGNLSLIGRIFSKKRCNANFIKTVLSRMWKTEERWEVKVYKHDNYIMYTGFSFNCENDFGKAKTILPWRFIRGLMIVEEWPKSGQWEDASLNSVPMWIRVASFPMKAFNESNVRRIGGMAGEVLKVNWKNSSRLLLSCTARMLVASHGNQSIMVGKHIKFDGRKQ